MNSILCCRDIQIRQEVHKLGEHQIRVGNIAQINSVENYGTARGMVHTTDNVHQRRLAGAGRAHERKTAQRESKITRAQH